ncbi:MAG: DUF3298 domain-containing protein [bacterium]
MSCKVFLLNILLLVAGISVTGQVYLPKKAYLHLIGRIDDKVDVTLNLVKINDSIYADLVYSESECVHAVLFGKTNPDGSFWMKNPFCDTGMVFNGNFVTRQKLSGTYTNSTKGNGQQPFVFVESYPAGSIPLQVFYQDAVKPLVSKPGSPLAEIKQCMIIPGESSNPVISDTLRELILRDFSDRSMSGSDPDHILQVLQGAFFDNYFTSNTSLYETFPDAGILNWELLKFMHLLYNDNNLLTYYILSYAYTGGAHGLETQNFTVVDISSGKAISLSDFFQPGFETKLTSILTQKLKQMNELPQSSRLSEHGFFVDEVKPNQNFYVTGRGIGFYYNHYEIAPYANGPTDIFLPFGEIKELVKKTRF